MRRLIPLLGVFALLANDCGTSVGVEEEESPRYQNVAGTWVGPIDAVTVVLNDTTTLVGTITYVIAQDGNVLDGTRTMAGNLTGSDGVEIAVQSTATFVGTVYSGSHPVLDLPFQDTACPNISGLDRIALGGPQLAGGIVIDITDAECNRVLVFSQYLIADRP